jgi:cyclopropane-fatty-acyl-phospholipid synthase
MAELVTGARRAGVPDYAYPSESWIGRLLRRVFARVRAGTLTLVLPSGERVIVRGTQEGPDAIVSLVRLRALLRLALAGDLGFAEAYRDGDWRTPDLLAVLRFASANEAALSGLGRGAAPWRQLARLRHALRRNTRPNSRRNVRAHYDLGNDFYSAWLDAGMNYSSGIYTPGLASLEAAQDAKLGRIATLLDLHGGERVLEIGCGWGPLTEVLAARGCMVTALTLSPRQRVYAQARLAARDLAGRADIRLQDYRDVEGTFDRIASVEMIEAVGEAYWPVYFGVLRDRLAPGGGAVLQVITIDPKRFETYRKQPDFIQAHIFPGGMLPTEDALAREAARAGLSLAGRECFAPSYARTLAAWRERFNAAWPRLEVLGFDEKFSRLWNYYLAYCQVGFESAALDVGLYRFERPQ